MQWHSAARAVHIVATARYSAIVAHDASRADATRVHDLPRELVHILARFAPFAAPALAQSSREFWARFSDDPFVWTEAIKQLRGCEEGRELLKSDAAALVAKLPVLETLLPVPLALNAAHFALTRDGAVIACGTNDGPVRLVDAATGSELCAFHSLYNIEQLAFSPSGLRLALLGSARRCARSCQPRSRLTRAQRT